MGVPFDLSEVMFIATANYPEQIPAALMDRMEVIEFSSYIEQEKLEIAKRYLLPRQLTQNGLKANQISFTFARDSAVGPRTLVVEVFNDRARGGGG